MKKGLILGLMFLIVAALPGAAMAEMCRQDMSCCAQSAKKMDCCDMHHSARPAPHNLIVPDFVKPVKKLVPVATFEVSRVVVPVPVPVAGPAVSVIPSPPPREHLATLSVLLI